MVSTLAFEASISGSNPEGTYIFFFALLRVRELFLFCCFFLFPLAVFLFLPDEIGDTSANRLFELSLPFSCSIIELGTGLLIGSLPGLLGLFLDNLLSCF